MRRSPLLLLATLLLACSSDDTTPASGAPSSPKNDAGGISTTEAGSEVTDGSAPPPPGGNDDGIAAKYPGDVGIENDPDVIFADGFEDDTDASDLSKKWDNFFQADQTKIVTDAANVKAGKKALEFTLPQQGSELSNGVQKILKTELDLLYLRWYSKFDPSFNVTGSSHNGGGINAHYFNGFQATPGVPADGTNKFLIEFECWRGEATDTSPGRLNVYAYHPEQRSNYGDHFFPTGDVLPNTSLKRDWGTGFVKRPDITPELGRWYAYELMVKANTVGSADGRVTLWLDGVVIGDFPNIRFRDVDSLKIDRFNLSLHAGSNPTGPTKKWYDAVVAAKKYIGPMK